MTCITPIHDPSSMCAQKFILYNINLTSPSIHAVCVFPVLFYLICHAEDGTQCDSLCMPALPLRHIAATVHYYSKEEFLVWFWFLVILSPSTCYWTQQKPYYTLLGFCLQILDAISFGLRNGHRECYPWFIFPCGDFKNCFPKQIADRTGFCQTSLQGIFTVSTPLPISSEARTCRLHSSAPP